MDIVSVNMFLEGPQVPHSVNSGSALSREVHKSGGHGPLSVYPCLNLNVHE